MNNEEIIDINTVLNKEPEEVLSIDKILDNNNEEKLARIMKEKKIERIQIGLILFLIVAGTLIYFFGYEIFKPFIPIDK